jgi:N-acetyl-anhydromuramyl-L-alanine amidase AmpD
MIDKPIMKTQGEFPKGFPEGAIVHFTAGRFEKGLQSAIDTIEYGASQGFAYWAIAIDGTVVRGHDVKKWGYHAGVSERSPLGKSVSKRLIGIEICCAGKVTKNPDGSFSTWYGTKLTGAAKARYIATKRYPEEETGYYHCYTTEQEAALVNLLMQFREDSGGVFSLDNVFGHDEVAMPRGRKNDPGGSLSVGMPEFRKLLKLEAQARGIK